MIFVILDTSQLKILVIVKVLIVEILCIFLLVIAYEHIKEKNKNKYLVFDSTDKNKKVFKKVYRILGLKVWLKQ